MWPRSAAQPARYPAAPSGPILPKMAAWGSRSRTVRPMCSWIANENADVVTAWATAAGVLVGLIAALAAIRQLRMISRDSRDRTRPYVQLDVVPGLQGPGSWDLIIENRGASAAHDVRIDAGTLEPVDDEDHIVGALSVYLATPRTLVPGARRRLMWAFNLPDRGIRAGVLEGRTVQVLYRDEQGMRRRRPSRPFEDNFLLEDVTSTAAGIYPAPTEGRTTNSNDPLKNINLAVRSLSAHVGELRR